MKTLLQRLSILVVAFVVTPTYAAFSPLSLGIMPPVQFPAEDFTITGLRLSVLYGKQRDVYGLDLGVVGNITEQTFAGIAVAGGFNITHGTTTVLGLQAAGGMNKNTNKTKVIGLQLALGLNHNTAETTIAGFQVAAVNLSDHTDIYGAQIGLYNRAENVYGLQIGVVNVANNLHGLQIGILNYHQQGLFKVSPLLNFGF